jgi:site-specific DNA-methyltransferase (adenine-specific)/adenine-specific DNA-methyltransferase
VALDGFRSGADVLIFNHMQEGGVILDHGFVDDFHTQIGSHVGTSVFIIAPAASVAFLEDYIEKGITRYYILRIPYSIINELHNHAFESLLQPVDKSQVNSTVEAVGFDFIKQPLVECSYDLVVRDGKTTAQVYISTFRSEALAKGASFKGNREALSMVLVDLDYPFDEAKGSKSPPPFELDLTFYASLLENEDWIVRLPFEQLGNHIMLIYIDIYGNEYTEVKGKVEFDTVSLAQPKLEPNQNQSPVTGRTSAVLKPAKATTIEASADPVARTQSEAQAQGSPAPTGQDTVA